MTILGYAINFHSSSTDSNPSFRGKGEFLKKFPAHYHSDWFNSTGLSQSTTALPWILVLAEKRTCDLTESWRSFQMDYCCMDFGSFELQKCKRGALFSFGLLKPGTRILRILSFVCFSTGETKRIYFTPYGKDKRDFIMKLNFKNRVNTSMC